MFVPITSEINIEIGTLLKEIATSKLFLVSERVKHGPDVAGEDTWRIIPADSVATSTTPLLFTRIELSEKYVAGVDETL